MTSLLRSNSFLFGGKKRNQKGQERNPRPKSPFSEISLFSWKQGSDSRIKEPYVRPGTADGILNSLSRRPSQGMDFIHNERRPSHAASMLCLAPPALSGEQEEAETVYIGLHRDSSYHKPLPSARLPQDTRIDTYVQRQRKDSVVSPQSGKNTAQVTPIRGNSPIRQQQHVSPPSIATRPKLNRWKSLGGLLGRKVNRSAGTAQATRTHSMMDLKFGQNPSSQVDTSSHPLRTTSRQAAREDPLRSNPINASLLNLTQKSKLKLQQASPLRLQQPQSPQSSYYEPTLISPISPLQMTPFIDIDIPDAKMERYSIMFEGVNIFRKQSLLERRRSTKEKLSSLKPLSVPKPASRPKTPTGRRRRSSSASSLSLFPSGHLNNNNSTTSLHARTPSGSNPALTPSHKRTSSRDSNQALSAHRRNHSGGSRPSPPRRTRTAPVDVLPPLVSPTSEPVLVHKSSEGQMVRPKTSDSQTSSAPNLSPVTPPPMLDLDPAATFLANRKAAPWEHRRMHRQPSWSAMRSHSRSDSQESDTWSVECAQVNQPRQTSTIIEEVEEIEDWHHTGEVQLARSLSLTRPESVVIKPTLKTVKRTPVQLEQNGHRRVKSQMSMPNLTVVSGNTYQQGFSVVLENC